MADAQLRLSRRALLVAACAAPVLGLSEADFLGVERAALWRDPSVTFGAAEPHPGTFAVTKWDRALARFRAAESLVLALEGDPDEDAFGRAHDRFNAALRRLLAAPAPDLPALATKLEIAVAAELADLTFAPPALAQLAHDARRLALRSS